MFIVYYTTTEFLIKSDSLPYVWFLQPIAPGPCSETKQAAFDSSSKKRKCLYIHVMYLQQENFCSLKHMFLAWNTFTGLERESQLIYSSWYCCENRHNPPLLSLFSFYPKSVTIWQLLFLYNFQCFRAIFFSLCFIFYFLSETAK